MGGGRSTVIEETTKENSHPGIFCGNWSHHYSSMDRQPHYWRQWRRRSRSGTLGVALSAWNRDGSGVGGRCKPANKQASRSMSITQSSNAKNIQAKRAERRNTCSDKGWEFLSTDYRWKHPCDRLSGCQKYQEWKGNWGKRLKVW